MQRTLRAPALALRRRAILTLVSLLAALAVAACSAGSSLSPSTTPASIDSPEEAAAAVKATDPRFESLTAYDPDLIGQCCFYEVTEVEEGYQVKLEVGWGDCPAGCINRHVWTYAVTRDGEVGLIGEQGDPVPPGDFPPRDGGAGGY